MSKLKLGFYPYTYARVSVMKSLLLKSLQWQSMLKMSVNEILRTLQEGNYKKEIDELGPERKDLTSLEMTLNRNMMATLAKLKRISDEEVQQVLKVYTKRYDIENFKTIIRSKMTGISQEEAAKLLTPSINHPDEYFTALMKKDSIQEILKALHLEKIESQELFNIENALDRAYFEEIFALSENLSGEGKALKDFIKAELEILNIKIILRLKREQFKAEDILKYLIQPGEKIARLAEKEDVKDIITSLYAMKYTRIKGDESSNEDDILTNLEMELDTKLLKKEVLLMHQNPLTVDVILGFMFAKEIEVRNLKVLLKGKQVGLEDNYLTKLMVVA